MSEELNDKIDREVDELVEKLSEEDQELLDQALAGHPRHLRRQTYHLRPAADRTSQDRRP